MGPKAAQHVSLANSKAARSRNHALRAALANIKTSLGKRVASTAFCNATLGSSTRDAQAPVLVTASCVRAANTKATKAGMAVPTVLLARSTLQKVRRSATRVSPANTKRKVGSKAANHAMPSATPARTILAAVTRAADRARRVGSDSTK
jgi:hypothetical protein